MASVLTSKPGGSSSSSSGGGGGAGGGLTKKVGPLPVWGWIAVAVVGYLVYRKFVAGSSSSTANQSATTIPNVAQETLSGPGGYYSGPWGGAPQGIVSGTGTTPTGTTPTPGGTGTPAPGGGSGTSPNNGFPTLPAGYTGWKLVQGPGGQTLAVVGGYNAQRQYSGFEVGNGAPVYAANPGQSYALGLPGASLAPGASFAVPTQYLEDVNTKSPVKNAPAFG